MNKLSILVLVCGLWSTASFASDPGYEFYSNQSQNWYIGGYTGDSEKNPACYLEYSFQDGSTFQLVKDLKDGELYIFLRNMQWNISDPPGEYNLHMNFITRSDDIDPASGKYYFELYNKNTITINWLSVDEFIPGFMKSSELRLIMPGDIENAYVPLEGSSYAIELIAECIDKSDKVKLYNDVVPKINS